MNFLDEVDVFNKNHGTTTGCLPEAEIGLITSHIRVTRDKWGFVERDATWEMTEGNIVISFTLRASEPA